MKTPNIGISVIYDNTFLFHLTWQAKIYSNFFNMAPSDFFVFCYSFMILYYIVLDYSNTSNWITILFHVLSHFLFSTSFCPARLCSSAEPSSEHDPNQTKKCGNGEIRTTDLPVKNGNRAILALQKAQLSRIPNFTNCIYDISKLAMSYQVRQMIQ